MSVMKSIDPALVVNLMIVVVTALFTVIRKGIIEELFNSEDAALISFVSQVTVTEWLMVFTLGMMEKDLSLAFDRNWLYLIGFMVVMGYVIKILDDKDLE